MSTAWDNARRHARALETALDGKIASYSKLAAFISQGSSSMAGSSSDPVELEEGIGGYKLVEEEVEELLGKVS
jgi:Golgi SNAP receptor complex protein 1